MIRVARNPDGTPDDVAITNPAHVHLEDMGSHWWLSVDTAEGETLTVNFHPTVTLPKELPAWLKVPAAKLLRWMRGRVRLNVLAEVEPAPTATGP